MNKQERERRALITLETANAADVLRQFIATCRAEDISWEEISKITKMPTFVIRVIAGETKANRLAPEHYAHRGR